MQNFLHSVKDLLKKEMPEDLSFSLLRLTSKTLKVIRALHPEYQISLPDSLQANIEMRCYRLEFDIGPAQRTAA